jgi:hypothetical protein
MGGERASSARMRLAGKVCCSCKSPLPAPHTPGERLCARCLQEKAPKRHVYMHFMVRQGWHIQFLEEDLKTPLPKKLTFDNPAKIYDMADRGGYKLSLENRQAIDRAIEMGRGSVWLDLTAEQYAKLKKR